MTRNAIKIHFRSSKIGGGGGRGVRGVWGASQWPVCKPFGDMHVFALGANTPILVLLEDADYAFTNSEHES